MSSDTSIWTVCFLSSLIVQRRASQAFDDIIASRLRELGFNVVRGSREINPTIGFADNERSNRLRYVDYFTGKSTVVELANVYIASAEDVSLVHSLFSILTTIDDHVTQYVIVILTPESYWKGLLDWLKTTPMRKGMVNKETLERITLLDDPESIVAHIMKEKEKNKTSAMA